MPVARDVDRLLDALQDLRRERDLISVRCETLRDALSECLAELPDSPRWYPHQMLYVSTDPEESDYPVDDDELDSEEYGVPTSQGPSVASCG